MATVEALAERRQNALARLTEAADLLADRHGLEQGGDFGPPVPVRDAAVRDVYRLERLADLLEGLTLVGGAKGAPTEELTVTEIRERVEKVTDSATLEAMLAAERSGKDRKTAVEAIQARIDEIEAGEGE